MKTVVRDILAAVLAVTGGVVVFAKLQAYNWWLIGSWKGALGVLAVLGAGILLLNIVDIFREADSASIGEFSLWVVAATVIIASLVATTTRAQFIWSSVFVGLAWVAQLSRHLWHSSHPSDSGHHYMPAR